MIISKCSLEQEEYKFLDEECTKLFLHPYLHFTLTSELFSFRAGNPDIFWLFSSRNGGVAHIDKEVAAKSVNPANDSLEMDHGNTRQLECHTARFLLMAVVQFKALVQAPK